ncbi:85 kda calcium-independent phospholipase a2 [Plakobranchus ocellatus]|uniref:85 kDa calcium-independent phospholipase a2 n=1 Tax=Plakobranchus ocellatus TaxID=259542 RepID=A0AAV4DRT5_9GAST|nr:85 kda calcium-independent phospholipase a2 [Plakobranchus ocellatus]
MIHSAYETGHMHYQANNSAANDDEDNEQKDAMQGQHNASISADPQTALGQAIRDGSAERVVCLLSHPQVSLNHRDVMHDLQTPLMQLCHAQLKPTTPSQWDHQEVAQDENGNRSSESIRAVPHKNLHGSATNTTALSTASSPIKQVLEAVECYHLLNPPGTPRRHEPLHLDQQDAFGRTLAMHACVSHNLALLHWALSLDCSLLAADREGRNLLHYAACSGSDPVIDLALTHPGALKALQTLDYQGYSPLDMARQRKFSGAVKRLGAALRAQNHQQDSTAISALAPRPEAQSGSRKLPAHGSGPSSSHSYLAKESRIPLRDSYAYSSGTDLGAQEGQLGEGTLQSSSTTLGHLRQVRAHVRSVPSPRGILQHYDSDLSSAETSQQQIGTLNPVNTSPHRKLLTADLAKGALKEKENSTSSHINNGQSHFLSPKTPSPTNNLSDVSHSPGFHDLQKINKPLAGIPARAATQHPQNGADRLSKSVASGQSPVHRSEGVSPSIGTSPTLSPQHEVTKQTGTSAFGHLGNNINILSCDQTSGVLLSPLRSSENHVQTSTVSRNMKKQTISTSKMVANTIPQVYITAPAHHAEPRLNGLLPKRQQQIIEQNSVIRQSVKNAVPDGSKRTESSETYTFEEEFVLDTPSSHGGSNERISRNRPSEQDKDNTNCSSRDSLPSPSHEQVHRESVSLPDLRDMTGQLVTTREVSPIFQQSTTCWAVRTRHRGDGKDNNIQETDQRPRHDKDLVSDEQRRDGNSGKRPMKLKVGSKQPAHANSNRDARGSPCLTDMEGGLPIINTSASERD